MKKLVAAAVMALCSHGAFAQMEGMEDVFHTGPATDKAAEAMMQEVMSSAMTAAMTAATANGGKEMNEKELARLMFKDMGKHADTLKSAMQKDCETQDDAKACACFYGKVDLKEMFSQMEAAVVNSSSEEEVQKALEPYAKEVQAQRAECKLK